METKKILVLGGKGKTGRRVAERLVKLGKSVRIGSRSEAPVFDWENVDTWPAALAGMDAVYITFQPDLAVPGSVQIIERFTLCAVEAGIKKLVLLSGRGEKEAQVCEQVVMRADVSWTIVRASWFNQNFSEGFFLEPVQMGHVALSRGDALEPFVDADDIADVVVESLINKKHSSQLYELTGPRLLTFRQAIAEIAQATSRVIRFESLTIEEHMNMLRQHQIPEDHIWLVQYLFTEVLDGRNASVTNDIEKVLGRKAKDFAVYAHDVAAAGIWNTAKEVI